MHRLALGLIVLLLPLSAADHRRKAPKPPDIQVMEATARRSEGKIALDGRIRNTGARPIQGLVLAFDLLAPGHAVITTEKGVLDEEVLEPGKESVFRLETNDAPRAVRFQINAADSSGRDLRVGHPGPFAIE